ncbi:MAG: signal peptidase I [Acutalibacteraceae bacterium]
MKILKKVFNIVINVLIVSILIISVLMAALALTSKSSGISNILGYAPISVQSDSMVPTFAKGDLIISKMIDENTQLNVDDVITFATVINGEDANNTHRIIKIEEEQGVTLYRTKGDNNPDTDEDPVLRESIYAVYTGNCLKGWGNTLDFLKSQNGFFFAVLLPMIIFFIYEAVRFVRNLVAYNREKAIEEATAAAAAVQAQATGGLSEEEMKAAVESYLKQQGKAAQQNTNSEDNTQDTEE